MFFYKKRILLAAIIIVLLALSAFTTYHFTAAHYISQLQASNQLHGRRIDSTEKELQAVLKIADTASIKQSFEQIDSSLTRINKSLAARGLGVIKSGGVSVSQRLEKNTLADFAKYYQLLTHDLESRLLFTPFGMPYHGPKSSGFGLRQDPINPDTVVSHLGLDFVGNYGDSVKVTADGIVRYAGNNGGYGNCIIVTHHNNFETLYGHLSKILVTEGMAVKAGSYIGLIGSTGKSTGPHLHYEVLRNSIRINPEKFLKL